MKSLNGTDKAIKYHALIAENKKTGASLANIAKVRTGLSLSDYLARPFNRMGYYEMIAQSKWLTPKISFWEL